MVGNTAISKLFADDYKAFNSDDYRSNPQPIQTTLDSVYSWSDTWQLNLSLCGSLLLSKGVKTIDDIEDVQKFYTKRLQGLWNLSYADRLMICGIQSLELRRLIIDLVLVYKIVFKLVNLDFDRFFIYDKNTRTRGHNFKLCLPRCSTRVRQNFFCNQNNFSLELSAG